MGREYVYGKNINVRVKSETYVKLLDIAFSKNIRVSKLCLNYVLEGVKKDADKI